METVFGAFERTAQKHGAKPFLHTPGFSYRETLERVRELAGHYKAAGYGPGHRVAFLLPSGADFLLHFLALNSLGASIVPLNPESKPAERDYVLQHSEASFLVTEELNIEKAKAPTGSGECS